MGVEINISGNNIGGNAKVLNDLKVSGNSQVNVKIKDTNIRDQAKVLNNRKAKCKYRKLKYRQRCRVYVR